ncbi:MAG: L-threonylcarbamoyladenylate synthase [Candidatus Paceibacterota bacterium]
MFILKLTEKNLNSVAKIAGGFIKKGKIVVCPTDTVYGLVCDATNKKAVDKIFKIKGRPKTKPIPVFVKDIKTASKIAKINKNQLKFLRKKWPGKFTAILKRRGKKKLYGIDKKTIAIRIPRYKLIGFLFEIINFPLAETSVNISGQPSLDDLRKIILQFEKEKLKPDLIIDAGKLKFNKPSAVVDLTGKKYTILRKG